MKEHKIEISTKSLFHIVVFVFALYVLFLIRHTVLLIFIALLFSTLIEPFAALLKRHHIPRAIAALLVYVSLFSIIGLSVTVLTRVVAHDLPQLIESVRQNIDSIKSHEFAQRFLGSETASQGSLFFWNQAESEISSLSNVFSSVTTIFGGVISLIIVLVITFYLVIQDDPLQKMLNTFVPEKKLPFVVKLIHKIRHKLGLWFRGQLTLGVIMGFLIFVILTLLQVKYALVIGLLAFLLEFIPYVGPILVALPAIFFGFVDGGVVKLIIVGISLIILQQFENHVLIPKIMQKAVGLNPIVSIISLIIGIQLGGILGGVLAIPLATTLHAVLEEYMEMKKGNQV